MAGRFNTSLYFAGLGVAITKTSLRSSVALKMYSRKNTRGVKSLLKSFESASKHPGTPFKKLQDYLEKVTALMEIKKGITQQYDNPNLGAIIRTLNTSANLFPHIESGDYKRAINLYGHHGKALIEQVGKILVAYDKSISTLKNL